MTDLKGEESAESVEEPEEVEITGIHREKFRKLVNRVVMFNIWQNVTAKDSLTARNLDVKMRLSGPRAFLIQRDCDILQIPPQKRTKEQNGLISKILNRIVCLRRFSKDIRENLAHIIYYNSYGKGRTVVKEGHEATGLYFLINGEITVHKRLWDNEKLTFRNQAVQALSSGEMFGEVGLLFDTERLVTCETATTCELFFVTRQDFEVHLRTILQEQWDQKKEILDRPVFREYFQNFSDKQIREACVLSKLHKYERDEIVFREDNGLKSFVYFLLAGQCSIIQCLKVDHSRKRPRLIPLDISERRKSVNILDKLKDLQVKKESVIEEDFPPEEISPSNPASAFNYFVVVGAFKTGAIFGLGEEMNHRSVVAKRLTECLLLPRYWLMQKEQNIGNIWSRTKIYLNLTLPSREATFEEFLRKRRWKRYKRDRMREYLETKSDSQITARLEDVPILCRIENGF
ncbi:cyclic nucleotide-binding domain-containing protein 2-like [Phlebotomus argentipes]|uniref:cyclic nucleotide-binding domain-containing protein 2-like n=1 Tax=Phlebotomus argentipes TaxID=94469 RepID=UPI00289321F7|nr:cyclic nucleotide-binding domain-containing protein 2-like [Phlebotomus argentipes]